MSESETTPKTAEAHNLATGVGHASFREYPAQYECRCFDCGNTFIDADKRALFCEHCRKVNP